MRTVALAALFLGILVASGSDASARQQHHGGISRPVFRSIVVTPGRTMITNRRFVDGRFQVDRTIILSRPTFGPGMAGPPMALPAARAGFVAQRASTAGRRFLMPEDHFALFGWGSW